MLNRVQFVIWILSIINSSAAHASVSPRGFIRKEASGSHKNVSASNTLGTAVCITGQYGRFEWKSKLKNVIEPLAKNGSVALFVSLNTGSPAFSNTEHGYLPVKLLAHPGPEEIFVQNHLGQFYKGGQFVPRENTSGDLSLWPKLREELPQPERQRRLTNYINQFKQVHACVALITSYEAEQGLKFDTIIKLRDNTMAVKPLPLPLPKEDFVEVKSCIAEEADTALTGSEGVRIEDKVMIVPRKHLQVALGSPFVVMATAAQYKNELASIASTEHFLGWVLRKVNGLPVFRRSAEKMPFVDGRNMDPNTCDGNGSGCKTVDWCLVPSWKDCRPEGAWSAEGFAECGFEVRR